MRLVQCAAKFSAAVTCWHACISMLFQPFNDISARLADVITTAIQWDLMDNTLGTTDKFAHVPDLTRYLGCVPFYFYLNSLAQPTTFYWCRKHRSNVMFAPQLFLTALRRMNIFQDSRSPLVPRSFLPVVFSLHNCLRHFFCHRDYSKESGYPLLLNRQTWLQRLLLIH